MGLFADGQSKTGYSYREAFDRPIVHISSKLSLSFTDSQRHVRSSSGQICLQAESLSHLIRPSQHCPDLFLTCP